MSQKAEKVGVVVSQKMQKSIVVAVEWQVKVGDMVAIVETRPLSRRKRWALKSVVRQAATV
jgi:ribosomal protein S17